MKIHDLLQGEMDKAEFAAAETDIRTRLLQLQRDLLEADFPVILLLEGDDRIGVNEVLARLHEWLDPRSLAVNVYDQAGEQARERPFFWRYWRDLPADGRIGIYVNGWATRCASERLLGEIGPRHLDRRLASARDFERQLVADGALLVKIWLHLDRRESARKLRRADDEPEAFWRLEDEDRYILEHYPRAMRVAGKIIEETDEPAPWIVVDGRCERFRDVTVGRLMREQLERRLASAPQPPVSPPERPTAGRRLLDLDLDERIDDDVYESRKDEAQRELARQVARMRRKGRSLVLVFEGPDAAGKGGSIRRVARSLDARDYRAHSIAAPTDEESARHYLWRFWRRLPGEGKVAIFDRSWYGRLLVERVEGFAPEADWRRAFEEIPSFERQLVDHGAIVLKFWLQIDPDEQMRRFEAREETPWKRYKITAEDYRNRGRWDDYQTAAEEMFAATDRPFAPWVVLAANDKRLARVRVLEAIGERLEAALAGRRRRR